jgi:DNA-binding NtrC family response regulator
MSESSETFPACVGRMADADRPSIAALTAAVQQLTGLVGRVPMLELVGDTTGLIERQFIEAALDLTHHNRTAAAQLLGVSRQSLYVKLRRYKLGGRAGVEVS